MDFFHKWHRVIVHKVGRVMYMHFSVLLIYNLLVQDADSLHIEIYVK